MKKWRRVKNPKKWFLGKRVIGFTHLSGDRYRERGVSEYHWTELAMQHHGVLVKNEYSVVTASGYAVSFPRYTVKCDDGRTRKFQFIHEEA